MQIEFVNQFCSLCATEAFTHTHQHTHPHINFTWLVAMFVQFSLALVPIENEKSKNHCPLWILSICLCVTIRLWYYWLVSPGNLFAEINRYFTHKWIQSPFYMVKHNNRCIASHHWLHHVMSWTCVFCRCLLSGLPMIFYRTAYICFIFLLTP